jgi:hypothetical protein
MPAARRIAIVLLAAGAAAAALALWRLDPAGSSLFPRCPSRALLGVHCPGCGALRATHHLLHGDLAAAFRMNPLLVALAPLLAVGLLQDVFPRLWPRLRAERAPAWRMVALWGIVLGYGVLRNVPSEPFCWLAPRETAGRCEARRDLTPPGRAARDRSFARGEQGASSPAPAPAVAAARPR